MTVIAAIKDETGVYIGADSYGSTKSFQISLEEKIFGLANGQMAITGSYRGAQIVRETFPKLYDPIRTTGDVYKLVEWLRESFNKHGLDREGDKGKFPESEFTCLFATKDNIWEIEDNYAFSEHGEFIAGGIGRLYAMGAFFALKQMQISVKKKLLLAIEAACRYHPYVGGDIKIVGPIE